MTAPLDGSLEPLSALGKVAILAPHPDDESLGCGGLIARLAAIGAPPAIIVVSDGTGSHPNSPSYPPERLRALREEETREAVAALGSPVAPVFLRLRDTSVPHPGISAFVEAVDRVASALPPGGVDTIAVSFRHDPHCDHQAAFALAAAVIERAGHPVRLLEYVIWNDEAAATVPAGFRPRRLDIAPVLAAKLRAIACHRSQTTDLIADDPGGFRLEPAMLRRFELPWETYLEAIP
jgi:LmbE family N-acetylglucosaminyl deacetylase